MNSARNRTAGNTLLCSCALLPISIKMEGSGLALFMKLKSSWQS